MINRPPSQQTQPQKVDRDSLMPCKIVFLTGKYKGKALDLGVAISETSHSQTSTWEPQDGRSIRIGSTFKNVGSRQFQISLQFYSPDKDISEQVENIFTLQEIDEQTGFAPTLLYREGSVRVAPVVVSGAITLKKQHPFPGGKGFHFCEMQIPLELLGGKASEHRFAKPLTETELTRAAAKQTEAERQKQGTIVVAQQLLIDCLSPQENQQLQDLLQGDKLTQPGEVSKLDSSAFIQAAVAGLIPKSVLQDPNIQAKLQRDLATELARKTDGVGNYGGALASAIQGNASILPNDLRDQVAKLKDDYLQIEDAISRQELDDRSPIFTDSGAANRLISVASCGLRMRNSGASGIQKLIDVPPEQRVYFEAKLGNRAEDQVARDQLVLDQINKVLVDGSVSDSDIQTQFNLGSAERVKALRNGVPYLSKDEFVKRLPLGVEGLNAFSSYTTYLTENSTSSFPPLPGV